MLLQRICSSQIIQARSNLQGVLSSAPIGNEEKPCCDDRITVLHESILHHIMPFMPAQEVVRTSMISRTWRLLWTSAPCLDMDIDHFDMDRLKFNKFAESLFERRGIANATLDTLPPSLVCHLCSQLLDRSCYLA